jgi:type II restriction enzyme
MGLNLDQPSKWKTDIVRSVDMYNDWFMNFAPEAFRSTRIKTTAAVIDSIYKTDCLKNISPEIIMQNPSVLATMRMSTCPPIAVDRLIGLAGVGSNLIKKIEKENKLPDRMNSTEIRSELAKVCTVIQKLLDKDIFPWLESSSPVDDIEVKRASTIIADRLCGAVANPIIRNAQEKRQLSAIKAWLETRGYKQIPINEKITLHDLQPGTFAFRLNVQVKMENSNGYVNIPADAVVKPRNARLHDLPLLIEAKSAGDFTNVNKRRKEEAHKMMQLKSTYGQEVRFILFLCGYFDSGYLGYEAAEGIDWVWEHSIDDLAYFVNN